MRRGLKSGAAVLAIAGVSANAWAGEACTAAPDIAALQTAAVQQRFMVAALTCGDVVLYNSFVGRYRRDLQQSDAKLLAYFQQANAAAGSADYNAYKTQLANIYSLRSEANKKAYCRNAEQAFERALAAGQSLEDVVSVQPVAIDRPLQACGDEVPGGGMDVRPGAGIGASLLAHSDSAPATVPVDVPSVDVRSSVDTAAPAIALDSPDQATADSVANSAPAAGEDMQAAENAQPSVTPPAAPPSVDRRYSDRYEANSRPRDAYTNRNYRTYRRGYDRYGRPLPNYYYYPPAYYPPAYYSYPWRR
jgi:hypothetical protein